MFHSSEWSWTNESPIHIILMLFYYRLSTLYVYTHARATRFLFSFFFLLVSYYDLHLKHWKNRERETHTHTTYIITYKPYLTFLHKPALFRMWRILYDRTKQNEDEGKKWIKQESVCVWERGRQWMALVRFLGWPAVCQIERHANVYYAHRMPLLLCVRWIQWWTNFRSEYA